MIKLYISIILLSFIFPKTEESDTTIIIIEDINIYGGLNELSTSSNIDIINSKKFKLNGNNNFQDLIPSIANLHYAGGTSRSRYFQIRGLGELSQFSGEGAPHFYIGYILDNIDFSGVGMVGILTDIKQIEIFKGPQSSVYGPNAMAGLINIVSTSPSIDKSLHLNTSLYSNNGFTINISSSIPITKKLLSRYTISKNNNNGFIVNKSDPNNYNFDTNAKDELLIRTKFIYNPNINSSITLTLYSIRLNNKYDVWTPDNNGFTTFTDYQGYDTQRSNAFSMKSKFNLKNSVLTSITSYSDNIIKYSYDGDWANSIYWEQEPYNWHEDNSALFSEDACIESVGYYPCYYDYDFTDETNRNKSTFSQEFRIKTSLINNTILTSGFYYSKIKEIDKRDGWLFAGHATNIRSIFDIFNYATYLQLSYPITTKLLISSTIRFDINDTRQDLSYSLYDMPPNSYHNNIKDKDLIGGSIKLNHQYTKSLAFTYLLSRGYKTSGINQTQYPNFNEDHRIYKTEYCNNIDFGITYNKKKYKIRLSSFYMHRVNPQLRLSHQYDHLDPTSFDYATYNANFALHYGLETNIVINISDFLTISQSISLLKTYVSKFEYLGTTYGDRELSHAPNKQYGLGLIYDFSKYIKGLELNLESNYIGNFYFEEQNNSKSKPYKLIDISLKYEFQNIEISLWSKNVENNKYVIRSYTFGLDPTGEIKTYKSYGDPRTLGITLGFKLFN